MGRPLSTLFSPLHIRLPGLSAPLALFNRTGGNHSLWWRTCQLVAMTTALVSLYTFILLYISVTSLTRQQKPRPVTWLKKEQLQMPTATQLVDMEDFHYTLQPKELCAQNGQYENGNGLYFLIYVHSSPDHTQERKAIRSTWGSLGRVSSWGVKVIFLLGLTTDSRQKQLEEEQRVHGDLVQGNFVDSYRNLSYKHLMGYKWILSNCPRTTYIVKVDDDSFVDVVQLFKLLDSIYGGRPSGLLACSLWPAGSAPQRQHDQKWAVNVKEYPYDVYPAYCGGLAYVVSPDVARDLLAASCHVPFFWIDDLYVTGLLAESLPHIRHHAFNLRTTYDAGALLQWLREPTDRPCPYIFGDVSGGSRSALMHRLWQKTSKIWKKISNA